MVFQNKLTGLMGKFPKGEKQPMISLQEMVKSKSLYVYCVLTFVKKHIMLLIFFFVPSDALYCYI